jgi:hypothetical protein
MGVWAGVECSGWQDKGGGRYISLFLGEVNQSIFFQGRKSHNAFLPKSSCGPGCFSALYMSPQCSCQMPKCSHHQQNQWR